MAEVTLRNRVGRLVRRSQSELAKRTRRRETAPITGVVEKLTRYQAAGWIAVPAGTPPVPVTLYIDDIEVSSTFPTANAPVSAEVGRRGARDTDRPPGIPSPAGDFRNSEGEVRVFNFQLRGLWRFMNPETKLTFRVAGNPIPIAWHGQYLNPHRSGPRDTEVLKQRLRNGYKLAKTGRLTLSKDLDQSWQEQALDLYEVTRRVLEEKHGYDAFLMYGSLLGSVREGGPIGHDDDFDCAYVSRHRTGPEAAEELVQIALDLIEAGLSADLRINCIHLHDPVTDQRIDIFHSWFDADGRLRIPWGVAGTAPFHETDWQGTEEVDFIGGQVLRPRNGEKLLAHLYGDDWRQPKPGFNWASSRTDAGREGRLSTAQRTKVYWANFYARTAYTSGSTFFEFVNAHEAMPTTVIDIGCGDGRDSCAFGGAGRRVLGLDQSPVGIENARGKAVTAGVDAAVRFEVCDVADVDELGRVLDEGVEGREGPILFYLRFFLHAINEEVQARLLAAIRTHARPGDVFAAEFRTDKDEAVAKVHGNHYRRFQNAVEFRDSLAGEFGFSEVLFEVESTGLSPYGDEDPVLYRVIARRPA